MTSTRRARDTHQEVQRLNLAVQTLAETSLLGLPVTHEDIFKLLQMTRIVGYHAARALDSLQRDEHRRHDDTRLPPFDGIEDAQNAAAKVVVAVDAASIGEQVRRALAGEVQS